MVFSLLVRDIELYLRMEGTKPQAQIKSFINEVILDFIRMKEWDKVKKSTDFTLDDSDSYLITGGGTPIAADFEGELALFDDAGVEYTKTGYPLYLQQSSKTQLYAIFGDTLYVEGASGDLTLLYIARGTNYPLVTDAHEVPATQFYPEIIKQMVVVRFLEFIGDDTYIKEKEELDRKLVVLRASENRVRKNGKIKLVQR